MSNIKLSTKYLLTKRLTREEVERQSLLFQKSDLMTELLGKIPAVFIIVNKYRQIIYMNKGALELTGLEDLTSVIGVRPGELLGCIHATEEEGGCGTSESCTYCGAVNAILKSQKDKSAVSDCRLVLRNDHSALDLRVWASPLIINKEEFTIITIQDIQHEKRRAFLERIFFHDILNTTNVLQLTLQLLSEHGDYIEKKELIKRAKRITQKLIEEILSQRLLIDAENKLYEITINTSNSIDILDEIIKIYAEHELTEEKTLKIAPSSKSIDIHSDRTLLRRILGNMIKNALEAAPKDGTVTIGCETIGENIKFWVHNLGFIPRDIQLQIFNRSFSTKSQDRGLGTYSMKLLSSILKGTVNFTTSEENGTIFNVEYPIKLEDELINK
ncbi:MAG: histidine kinase [Candidatus Lokiarchaeota archaeon]|nr:histidine kinase [Candidatus Lokiarchaeota archaeon]